MAANLDIRDGVASLFSYRVTPWHRAGVVVQEAPNSADALRLARLDWRVERMALMAVPEVPTGEMTQYWEGIDIPNTYANVRDVDKKVLGVVSNQYKILQNVDAFKFTDELLGHGVKYETAGALDDGKRVWILAKLNSFQVAGDLAEMYLWFANSHDGKSAMRAGISPIRVVCQNSLNLAIKEAKRSWSIHHRGDVQGQLTAASSALGLANKYTEKLTEYADLMANKKFPEAYFEQLLEKTWPAEVGMSTKAETFRARSIDELRARYYLAPDLKNFRGTAWGAIQAITDFTYHREPVRKSEGWEQRSMVSLLDGDPLMDKMVKTVEELVA